MVNKNETERIKNPEKQSNFCFYVIFIVLAFALALPLIKPDLVELLNDNLSDDKNSYHAIYEKNFFQIEALEHLKEIFRTIKFSIIADDTGIEGAGETKPAGHPDCKHPFMTYNANRTLCSFPHRLDIALHYMKTGGFGGKFDTPEKLASKLYSFRHKLMTIIDEKELFNIYGEKFLEKAKKICLTNEFKEYTHDTLKTEIFQFDVIVILPGQELPMHLDIPYFWGADRKSLPHWLLAVMKQSKLFDHLFIPQVQGVSWLSKHQLNKNEKESKDNGGNFYYFPHKDNFEKYEMVKAEYNAAILVDGTQVIHGVEPYKVKEIVPDFDKNNRYYLKFNDSNNVWDLIDYKENLMRSYDPEDIRISLVWRVHCFQNDQEFMKYKNQDENDRLSIDEIAKTFINDLKAKNKLKQDADLKPLDLWTLIVNEYIKYPVDFRKESNE
jgi:hypothetical protein